MNIDVAERLIANLKAELIEHEQKHWLKDHTTVFEIRPENRWDCATSGCAAGFIWLEEADTGSVFDIDYEMVFKPGVYDDKVITDYKNTYPRSEETDKAYFNLLCKGVSISQWAADKLGINSEESLFLFYQYNDTEQTIDRITFLMNGGDWHEYVYTPAS